MVEEMIYDIRIFMLILVFVFILITNVYYILANQAPIFEHIGPYHWEMNLF